MAAGDEPDRGGCVADGFTEPECVLIGAPILVNGGSGFVEGHVVLALLARGYAVPTTVWDAGKRTELGAPPRENLGGDPDLEIVVAELDGDGLEGRKRMRLHPSRSRRSLLRSHETSRIWSVLQSKERSGSRTPQRVPAFGVSHSPLHSPQSASDGCRAKRLTRKADWTDVEGPGMANVKSKTLAE